MKETTDMRFEELDSDELNDQFCIIKSEHKRPCAVCGRPTEFIEYCAEVHLCSPECYNQYFSGM